jgi:hypothetical protein
MAGNFQRQSNKKNRWSDAEYKTRTLDSSLEDLA